MRSSTIQRRFVRKHWVTYGSSMTPSAACSSKSRPTAARIGSRSDGRQLRAVAPRQHEVEESLAIDTLHHGKLRGLDRAEEADLRYAGKSSQSWTDSLPMIALNRAIHGSRSSRVFQTSARRPPGRSTRAISGSATAWSNQWKDCAQVTTSANASGSGITSASPRIALAPGAACGKKLQHLGQRLDRGDPVTERDETARQLSRSGAEVDDVARLVADEPAHRFVRVSRPSPLVGVRDTCERRRRPATGLISVDDHAARV